MPRSPSRRRRDRSSSRSRSHSRSPSDRRSSSSVSRSGSSSSTSSPSSSPTSSSRSSRSASRSGSHSKSKSYSSSSRSRSRSPRSHSRSRSRSRSSRSEGHRRRSPSPINKIHINRLTRNVNKQHLMEIFKTYGPVKSVEIPMDRFHPQLGRGSAYIEFEKSTDAEKAIRYMDGGQIDGQEIIVSKFRKIAARPIARRPMGGGHNRNGSWRRY